MHIRCPHCNHPVEIGQEDPLEEITCPSCGSSFHLISAETTETHHPDSSGTLGHVDLIQLIGQGHMGSVWKGQVKELDRTVAVKIPRRECLTLEVVRSPS